MININTKSSKALSICIPTLNRPEKIYNLLKLILPQINKSNVEIIITDNSSNDETEKKLELVLKQNSNISYYKNNRNIGFAKNLKKAILHSSGNYIWMLSDDDIPNPKSIKKILNVIEMKKKGWIFFNFEKSNSKTSQVFYDNSIKSQESSLDSFVYKFGVWSSFMSTSIIHSDVKNNLDSVKENNYFAYSLALVAGEKNGCSYINFPLIKRKIDNIAEHRFNKVGTYLFDFFDQIDVLINNGSISYKTRNSLARQLFSGIIPLYLCKIKLKKQPMPPLKLVYLRHKRSLAFYSNILTIYLTHRLLLRAAFVSLRMFNYIIQNNNIKRATDFLLETAKK